MVSSVTEATGGFRGCQGSEPPSATMCSAMARVRIIQWRDLPSLVEAEEGGETVRVPLSQRFQDLIDAVAMRDGATESEAYLAGWAPGPESERPGGAQAVAQAVADELEAGFQDLVVHRFPRPPPYGALTPPPGPP